MPKDLINLPIIGRDAMVRAESADQSARTVEIVWTTGATVRRWSWTDGEIEESLKVTPEAVDMARLNSGAPFLNSHNSYNLEAVLGVVVDGSARVENGQGFATIRFSDRDDVEPIWRDITNGIIRSVSVGYRVRKYEITREEGKKPHYRAIEWEPLEISAVAIGADAGAHVRSLGPGPATTPCVLVDASPAAHAVHRIQEIQMPQDNPAAAGQETVASTETRAASAVAPAPQAPPAPAAVDPVAAERQRTAAILTLCQRHGLADRAAQMVADGITIEAARAAILDHLAAQTAPATGRSEPVLAGSRMDETETRRRGMEEALVSGLTGAQPNELGRNFHGMALIELAAERLGERRIPMTMGDREGMLRRAFHSTSDFPLLFENAMNRALASRYAMQAPTYRMIARQRSYQDFRDHSTVRVGDFPTLQPVDQEAGEIKAGSFRESRERTRVVAYGVRVNLSRQMLVNDNLSGLQQILNDRGMAVARFEDATFYAMMLSASGAGPTLLETGRAVFNTTDGSLAGTAAAITVPSISLARAALMKRKSLDGADLELPAAVLLTGPDKQTEAQQLLAPIQAQQAGNINPFSGQMELAVTAKITGNAWYVFASPDVAPCFEWGLLDGYTAPRFRIEEIFGTQGTSMTLEHDFGCGAIDWRGGYRNAGA
jgi:hypothetical protein